MQQEVQSQTNLVAAATATLCLAAGAILGMLDQSMGRPSLPLITWQGLQLAF